MDNNKFSDQVSGFSRFFGRYLAVRLVGSFFITWTVRIWLGFIVLYMIWR